MIALILSGAAGFLTYLLLAGTVSIHEVIVGTILGLSVAAWTALPSCRSTKRLSFSRAHFRPWGRAFAGLPTQSFRVARFLVNAAFRPATDRGKAAIHPFRYGALDDPAECARRATAVLAASLAPASYAVQAAPGQDHALLHVVGDQSNDNAEWLV